MLKKKAITPIIAVILLLLITLSLAGMAMVIFTQLGKSSQQQLQQQLQEMNIRGQLSKAIAEPNTDNFTFNLINYAKIQLPIDGKNTKLVLDANGIPIDCAMDPSGQLSVSEDQACLCCVVGDQGECDTQKTQTVATTGTKPGVKYKILCNVYENAMGGPFSITKNYQIQWYFLGEGGEKMLDTASIIVGAIS